MKRFVCVAGFFAACGVAHDRSDIRDASVDVPMGETRIFPDANPIADAPVELHSCAEALPTSAFVQDRITDAASFTIQRNALAYANAVRLLPDPSPMPGAMEGARPMMPVGFGECGDEPIAGYAWDGHRCRGIRTTYCATNDCRALAPTQEQCADAHSHCAPEICRRSGGQWSEVPLTCAVWTHGVAPWAECDGPVRAQCICPLNQSPTDNGCLTTALALTDEVTACYASGGYMAPSCGAFTCGVASPQNCAGVACNCGANRNVNPRTMRCEFDTRCSLELRFICTQSGGIWDENACGAHRCGVPNAQRCLSGGCNCGALGVFSEEFGCLLAPTCRTNACF